MADIVRCGNCIAPLPLDAGTVVTCTYCGAQTRLDVAQIVATPVASRARLAEAVSFVASPKLSIPFLAANASLPIFCTETLSTHADDQAALHVHLAQGATPLAQFEFPIMKRGPRGVPKIRLTVRVSAQGEMSLTLVEPGTGNELDRTGLKARVLA